MIDLDALIAKWKPEFDACSDNADLDVMRNVVNGIYQAKEITRPEYVAICAMGKQRREELTK
jgi:hypothetical protein